jgi:MoaA/NifB/PqqE/SkfB family radical SAM enzyme
MKPCTRVGIDVTWKCQQRCRHCFYLRSHDFHKADDVPMDEVTAKIDRAKAGGLDHVVMVGYGEPSLCGNVRSILAYCRQQGMASSMITNGATGLKRFKSYFADGIDHLHLSSHGLDGTLDDIVHQEGAFRKLTELKEWLAVENLPFRTNVTMQQRNFRELPQLADFESQMGSRHVVLLGFLPHYEWNRHVNDVAVHPGELRPYIEDAARILLAHNVLFTIRYHPLCHLSPEFWPYVTNARYVFFDPWEWNYELQVHDLDALWRAAINCGNTVAIHGQPCCECVAQRHCGGWNRIYAGAFDGAGLKAIREIPDQYADGWDTDGALHDRNPANHCTGTMRPLSGK